MVASKNKAILSEAKKHLLEKLPIFLSLKGKEQYFLGKALDSYAVDLLERLHGNYEPTPAFGKFIDILYGCRQLDDFGEPWAPTEEKVKSWIAFLKKFAP